MNRTLLIITIVIISIITYNKLVPVTRDDFNAIATFRESDVFHSYPAPKNFTGNYQEGRKVGFIFKKIDVYAEVEMKNGIQHGNTIWWSYVVDKNGSENYKDWIYGEKFKQREGIWKNGKRDGRWIWRNEYGNIVSKGYYKNGSLLKGNSLVKGSNLYFTDGKVSLYSAFVMRDHNGDLISNKWYDKFGNEIKLDKIKLPNEVFNKQKTMPREEENN